MTLKKTNPFKDPDIPEYVDHKIAIKSIAQKYNLDPKIVHNTIKLFFSQGLKKNLVMQKPVDIVAFGQFKVNQIGMRIKERRGQLFRMSHNKRMKKFMKKWRARKASDL